MEISGAAHIQRLSGGIGASCRGAGSGKSAIMAFLGIDLKLCASAHRARVSRRSLAKTKCVCVCVCVCVSFIRTRLKVQLDTEIAIQI